MTKYLVTVSLGPKWEKEHNHDPLHKKDGQCPAYYFYTGAYHYCTDVTGRHHTFVMDVDDFDLAKIKDLFKGLGMWLTRVEDI